VPTLEYLAIHIMKTAGTSLRGMLADGLGAAAVYPNDDDLHRLPKGWYPGPADLVEQVHAGSAGSPRLVIGHLPYTLVDALVARPRTITLLRDPIARAVSMLEHRRTRSKRHRGASYADLLADESFVARKLRDYQTKTFAFDHVGECATNINIPLEIDDARFERALARLDEVDVLGVVEQLPAFTRQLQNVTGIAAGEERTANRGAYDRDPLPDDIRRRLEVLTARDAVLYRRAEAIVAARDRTLTSPEGHPRWSWRGSRRRRRGSPDAPGAQAAPTGLGGERD
jgi:hypothetical protein